MTVMITLHHVTVAVYPLLMTLKFHKMMILSLENFEIFDFGNCYIYIANIRNVLFVSHN